MQGHKFTVSVHLSGTLAANQLGSFLLPFAATLIAVSAVAQNNSDATLTVGTVVDPDGYLSAKPIGDSGAPVQFDKTDWDGALFTGVPSVDNIRVAKDTAVAWALDFDGAAGTAAQNVSIIFTFVEG